MPEKIHHPHLNKHTCIPCQVPDIPLQKTVNIQKAGRDDRWNLAPVALKPCPNLKVDYVFFYTCKNVKLYGNWYLDPQKLFYITS